MDNCTILAETGGNVPGPLLLVGALVTIVGIGLLVITKRRARPTRAATAWVLAAAVLMGGTGAALVPTQAHAAAHSCDSSVPADPTIPVATPEPTPDPTEPPAPDPTEPTDPTDPGETPDPIEPGGEDPEQVPPVAADSAATVATFEWQNSERDWVPGSDDQLVVVATPTFTFDVLAQGAATAPATLDPTTIDLDPSTPGVQRIIETDYVIASADPATGVITVSLKADVGSFVSIKDIENLLTSIAYTVSDSNGLTSAVATITVSTIIQRVPAET